MIADAALRQRYFLFLVAEGERMSLIAAARDDKAMLDDRGRIDQALPAASAVDHARRNDDLIEEKRLAAIKVRAYALFLLAPQVGEQVVQRRWIAVRLDAVQIARGMQVRRDTRIVRVIVEIAANQKRHIGVGPVHGPESAVNRIGVLVASFALLVRNARGPVRRQH